MASITFWTRLEPRTRAGSAADPLARGLRAQVRDPLWLLARQWQVGEFLGEDAGSPVSASVQVRAVPLTSYRPALTGAGTALGTEPLEVRVEAEDVELGLRGSVQLGARFEAMLREAGLGAAVADFRAAYPIASEAPADEISDTRSRRFRLVAAGRVTDGVALFAAAKAAAPSLPAAPAFSDPALAAQVAPVVAALVAYRDAVYREPTEASPWVPTELHYEFSIGSETADGTKVLDAPDFTGGHLDWYSFSAGKIPLADTASGSVLLQRRTFLPNALGFGGMPRSRWWDFEDAVTDWGAVDAERVDLAKLLVMEFALLYSDDWQQLPLLLPASTLARVERLAVDNSFGERSEIPPAASSGDWRMFAVSGDGLAGALLVAPTLAAEQDGPRLEEVVFLRDDMAAMAWGVEQKLQGPLDAPVDGFEAYRERLRAEPPPETPTREVGGPEIRYVVGTTVPDNWIPLVPVNTSSRSLMLRRGLMQRPTETGLEDVHARGQILEPWHPFYVVDEAVPQAGARVSRAFRRVRWSDGSTHVWIGRRAGAGRGPGWSGLAFDVVERLPEPSVS